MEHVFYGLAAVGGGAFGAAIGANYAFAFMGLAILAGVGVDLATYGASSFGVDFIDSVAFGPVFGPHVAFAGGVAAAAYAAFRKYGRVGNAKDITTPLAGTGQIDVMAVGGLFGFIGYGLQVGLAHIPWFGGHTDSVALTVVLSGVLVRLVFGQPTGQSARLVQLPVGSVFNLWSAEAPLSTRNKEGEDVYHWLPWQERPVQFLGHGFLFGLAAAFLGVVLPAVAPGLGGGQAKVVPFAFSAISIIVLNLGGRANTIPVTHHMTIAGGLGGAVFYDVFNGGPTTLLAAMSWPAAVGAILVGALCGALGAALGELFARLWWTRGDTHIDPPASSIWLSTLVISIIGAIAGCSFL